MVISKTVLDPCSKRHIQPLCVLLFLLEQGSGNVLVARLCFKRYSFTCDTPISIIGRKISWPTLRRSTSKPSFVKVENVVSLVPLRLLCILN